MSGMVQVGLGIIAFNTQGQFLMGQRLNSQGAGHWALPGGTLEFGESFAVCACREMREETGLDIDSVEVIGIANHIFPEHNKHFVALYCAARLISDHPPEVKEPHKCAGWMFVSDWMQLPQPTFMPYHDQVALSAIADYRKRYGLD